MDIKRTIITLALISAVWFVFLKFFSPTRPPATAASAPATAPGGAAGAPAPAGQASPSPSEAGGKGSASAARGATPTPRPPEQKPVLESLHWRATVTSYGAALEHFELKDAQYREKGGGGGGRPMDLVRTERLHPLETTFDQSDFQVPRDAAWKVEKATASEVELSWQSDRVRITKRFTAPPSGKHVLGLSVAVKNLGEKPIASHLQLLTFARHDFTAPSGGFLNRGASQNLWEAACAAKSLEHATFDALKKSGGLSAKEGELRWGGVMDRYFLFGAAMAPDVPGAQDHCHGAIVDAEHGIIETSLGRDSTVPPGQEQVNTYAVFGGPKLLRELDAVSVAGHDPKMGDAVDYGIWGPISRVMLWVLVNVHRGVGSWGVAIIALTLLVKILTYPLTQKGLRSGKEMAKLKPKLDALQKRYKDDKQRLNMEVMNLYKTHGVNPLGGCLPMLIQFPVWLALYRTLGNAVELYRSSFLWMHDLTQADPYFITPISMGVFMFLQQRITPMPTDSEQQKMMMYMMPIIFTFMSLWFPAGLTVYILTNTLLSMAQQWWINRSGGEQGKMLSPARAS